VQQNLVKFGLVVSEIYARTDRQRDRHRPTHHNNSHPSRGELTTNKERVNIRLRPGSRCCHLVSHGAYATLALPLPARLRANMKSSTKPEVHNALQRSQRGSSHGHRQQTRKISWRLGVSVRDIYLRTDRQTDRQTDRTCDDHHSTAGKKKRDAELFSDVCSWLRLPSFIKTSIILDN